MPSHFQVQDLVSQTSETLVYRALARDETPLVLSRLRLEGDAVGRLRAAGVFDQALGKLKSLNHAYLRKVIDGAQEDGEGYPWVTSLWMEGKPLSECRVEEKEIRMLGKQFHALLADLGDSANAVNFDPDQILTVRTPDDQLHALFSIDYGRWFDDWASGRSPGSGKSATAEVRKLLEGLAVRQLRLPKKERKQDPIPFVEERSPALTSYEPPREPWLGRVMVWLGILISLGVIAWLTWQGTSRTKENPRKEIPVWKLR